MHSRTAHARAVVIATGARYRRLPVDGIARFEGVSVHYWASPIEARLCAGQPVVLVGGGNSAGQGAVFLAGYASRVTLLARRPPAKTMSRYPIEHITAQSNIEVLEDVEIKALEGKGSALKAVRLRREGEPRPTRSTNARGSLPWSAFSPLPCFALRRLITAAACFLPMRRRS